MHRVIVKSSSYDYDTLRTDVFDVLSRLDAGVIKRGSKVLIKPNFLTAATVDQAVTTHPLVIKASVEYALSKGASVQVSAGAPCGQ